MLLAALAALLIPVLAACGSDEAATGRIEGRVTRGPICPPTPQPGGAECRDRAVEGATMRILRGGDLVERAVTGADGRFAADVPAGDYRLEPQPVPGALGTPAPSRVAVGAGETARVAVRYDTGIR